MRGPGLWSAVGQPRGTRRRTPPGPVPATTFSASQPAIIPTTIHAKIVILPHLLWYQPQPNTARLGRLFKIAHTPGSETAGKARTAQGPVGLTWGMAFGRASRSFPAHTSARACCVGWFRRAWFASTVMIMAGPTKIAGWPFT